MLTHHFYLMIYYCVLRQDGNPSKKKDISVQDIVLWRDLRQLNLGELSRLVNFTSKWYICTRVQEHLA